MNTTQQLALKTIGAAPIERTSIVPKDSPFGKWIKTNGTVAVYSINGIRFESGNLPIVFKGAFYRPLKSPQMTEVIDGEPKTRYITWEDRNNLITPPCKYDVLEEDEDGNIVETQNIYLARTQACGADGTERPVYHLFIESEVENDPIILKVDVWGYEDGTKAIEIARDGFSWRGGSNKVFLDGNTVNKSNSKSLIGYIYRTLEDSGLGMPVSTSATYPSRQAHLEDRKKSLEGNSKDTTTVVTVGKVVKTPTDSLADPFAE